MKTFLLPIFLLASQLIFSQDIMVLKNGDEIECRVETIGLNEITYKKYSNITGPVYTELKKNVFMIKFENGTKEVFNSNVEESEPDNTSNQSFDNSNLKDKELAVGNGFLRLKYYEGDKQISKSDFKSLLRNDAEAYEQYRNIGTHRVLKVIFDVTSIVSLVGAIISLSADDGYGLQLLVLSAVSGFAGTLAKLRIKSRLHAAVLIYNKNLYKNP